MADRLASIDTTKPSGAQFPAAAADEITFTGTVSGLTKAQVGLGSVDNTADSAKPVSTAQAAAISAAQLIPVNAQTAAYTLGLADAGKAVEVTAAAAVNVTVPPNSAVAFPVGTVIEIGQLGAGLVTLVAGSGVTLQTASSLVTRAQFSALTLRKRATDVWLVSGDMQ